MRPASETCPPACALSSTLPHSRIRHLAALACGGLQLALGQPSAGVFGTPTPSLHRQVANFALAGLQPQDTAVPEEQQALVTGDYKAWSTHCAAFQNPPCDHVPGCGAGAFAFALSSPLRFGCKSRDLSGHEGAGDEEIRFAQGAFSSLQLHPASSVTACHKKVLRAGKTVYATVLCMRSRERCFFLVPSPTCRRSWVVALSTVSFGEVHC